MCCVKLDDMKCCQHIGGECGFSFGRFEQATIIKMQQSSNQRCLIPTDMFVLVYLASRTVCYIQLRDRER
jgi:hypothetical protein